MKKIFAITLTLLLCSSLAFASKIEGKWAASIDTDNGTFEFTLDYKVDGEKLSGTISSDMGSLDFTDGKIEGETFEYKLDIDGYVIKHKGKILNEKEIEISSSGDYGERDFVIKKVEN